MNGEKNSNETTNLTDNSEPTRTTPPEIVSPISTNNDSNELLDNEVQIPSFKRSLDGDYFIGCITKSLFHTFTSFGCVSLDTD